MRNVKKRKSKKFLYLLVVIILVICIFNFFKLKLKVVNTDGIIQVSNKDGYTTIFKSGDKKYIEYKQGFGASWANNPYWDNEMWDNGCGITCVSVILSGYGINITPEDLRQMYYPCLVGDDIPLALINDFGLECSEFIYIFTKQDILYHLKENNPILICVNNRPNSRWTTASHYMVLLSTNDKNEVYVSNTNAQDGSPKSSGWYNISDVYPYIVMCMFLE